MDELKGPWTQPGWRQRMAANILFPLMDCYSGEVKLAVENTALGCALTSGRVKSVWMSVQASGKDDDDALQISGEVFINGATCLSTLPAISHVSGEASQHKTTKVTGDTGIQQGVVDVTANTFTAGDIFTYEFYLERTTPSDAEIAGPCIVVELEPIK